MHIHTEPNQIREFANRKFICSFLNIYIYIFNSSSIPAFVSSTYQICRSHQKLTILVHEIKFESEARDIAGADLLDHVTYGL